MTYISPSIIGDSPEKDQDFVPKRRQQLSARKSPEPVPFRPIEIPKVSQPEKVDWPTYAVIFVIGALLSVSLLIMNQKAGSNPFCSEDRDYSQCDPCPKNGTCLSGQMKCNEGFVRIGRQCFTDTQSMIDAQNLANKIGRRIASDCNSYCNASNPVPYEAILNEFHRSPSFEQAIERLPFTQYGIYRDDSGSFVAKKPILSRICTVQRYITENSGSAILACVALILLAYLAISVYLRIRTRREITRTSDRILHTIAVSSKGKNDTFYVSSFELLDNDRMSKHWEKIVREVEKNPNVCAMDTVNGRIWRLLSKPF